MTDNEKLALITVEAYSSEEKTWKPVWSKMGVKEELLPEAEAFQDSWLDQGWNEQDIRIETAPFQMRGSRALESKDSSLK